MRLASYRLRHDRDGEPRAGVIVGDVIVDLRRGAESLGFAPLPSRAIELIQESPTARRRAQKLAERAADEQVAGSLREAGIACPLEEVQLLAPLGRPLKNVFCVGMNYLKHAEEGARRRNVPLVLSESPTFFSKAPTSMVGPYDPIKVDLGLTQQWDWEGELAVIIGRITSYVSPEKALESVYGYCCANDVSARDLQYRWGQWFKGKSMDSCSPLGPWIVTADEFGDPHTARVVTRVNGVVKQDGNTSDMIFRIEEIIHQLSLGTTLEPGDIIITGTPQGIGAACEPPEYLRPGDVLETEIERIGTLRNPVEHV